MLSLVRRKIFKKLSSKKNNPICCNKNNRDLPKIGVADFCYSKEFACVEASDAEYCKPEYCLHNPQKIKFKNHLYNNNSNNNSNSNNSNNNNNSLSKLIMIQKKI